MNFTSDKNAAMLSHQDYHTRLTEFNTYCSLISLSHLTVLLALYILVRILFPTVSPSLLPSPAFPLLCCNIPIKKQKLCHPHFKQIRHALPFRSPMPPPVFPFVVNSLKELPALPISICSLSVFSWAIFPPSLHWKCSYQSHFKVNCMAPSYSITSQAHPINLLVSGI